MRSLAEFAAFVREEHLEEYVVAELKLMDTQTIPLAKLFEHLTADQLKEMTVIAVSQFQNGYVREEHLEENVIAELKLVDTKAISLTKLFEHLTADQLKKMTVLAIGQFLTSFEKGAAYEEASESLRKWDADEIPGVPKDSIDPADLVLGYYVQKVSLLNFLPLFTSDPYEIIHIVAELEDYYTQVQANSIQLLFRLQKEAEANARLRVNQLNEAQKLAMIGSYDWEIGTQNTTCSPEMYRIFGLDVKDKTITLAGLSVHYHDEDRDRVNAAIKTAMDTLTLYDCEYRLKEPDGKVKFVHSKGKIIIGSDEKPFRLVGTIQDVTAQKKSQENLIQKTKELKRSNDDLQRFASVSSHDLKEPLRKIQTFADLLAEEYKGSANEETKSYTDRILTSCVRMERAIDDLLLYSRMGIQQEPFVKVDLKKLINEISDDYEVTIKQKHAKIVVENLPEIFAAPSEMRQLFQNLISNALKFNKPNTPPIIRISSKLEENKNEISIKDNGMGFDEKYTSQIFEVFQRLHSKDQYEGSGIGLSICKKIVEKYQGKITVESKLNEGTIFIITLPIKEATGQLDVIEHLITSV